WGRFAAANRRLVGVAPGSVWGTKRWPRDSFVELCRRLIGQEDLGIVLVGSGAEKEDADVIAQALGQPSRCLSLAGQTSVRDLSWIYPRLSALISNDSSPIHYASAFNIPTVGIFGATVPEMGFGPLADHSQTVGVQINCRPCSDHGPMQCPLGHFKCMR